MFLKDLLRHLNYFQEIVEMLRDSLMRLKNSSFKNSSIGAAFKVDTNSTENDSPPPIATRIPLEWVHPDSKL